MRKLLIAALAFLALVATVAALATPAAAQNSIPVSSTVILKVGDTIKQPPLFGRVESKKQTCVEGRRIKIIAVAPAGGTLDYADNRTTESGKWRFSSQLQGATQFRAKALAKYDADIYCKPALSPVKGF